MFFASVSAVISLVLDTSFLDCWTISASFAFTRLVISRLSPVLGMFPLRQIDVEQFGLQADGCLFPVLENFDLLSDRRCPVIDELGVRRKIDRKVGGDSSELLGMVLQLTSVSTEYFDDRFQMFFHKRHSQEANSSRQDTGGWAEGCTGFGVASVPLIALLSPVLRRRALSRRAVDAR